MPKKLLLCTPARGSRPLGGLCLRWNDIICADLHHLDTKDNWHQKTQDCVAWWHEVEDAAQTISSEHKTQEKEAKDKNKQRKSDQLKRQMHLCVLRKAAPSWPEIHLALQTTIISGTLSCTVYYVHTIRSLLFPRASRTMLSDAPRSKRVHGNGSGLHCSNSCAMQYRKEDMSVCGDTN